MMRRKPALGRRGSIRASQHAVLIVIGARRTETAYLKGLGTRFRRGAVTMEIVEKPGAPDQLVEYTRRTFELGAFDEVWCVTDVDHYEREGGKVTAALALAGDDIRLAISNPCFELWLLLHHEDCATHCADCREVHARLRKHLPQYDKTRLRFGDFAAGLDEAIHRAGKLGADHTRNPSTGVGRLVEAVLEKR
jgi:hypothetical protein